LSEERPPDADERPLEVDERAPGTAATGTSPGIEPGGGTLTVAAKLSGYLAGGGVLIPLATVLLAFIVGGFVVALTGSNPLSTYVAIFEGTGLNWLFPWVTGSERELAALNLQQTLLLTAPLILAGLAVAYAFRAGLFNIGGQGQYIVGMIAGVWAGSAIDGLPQIVHAPLCVVLATLAGAAWGGIAGLLKATTGANEVITTIMLNWIAIWVGIWLFNLEGPLQNEAERSVPKSEDILESARLPVFWGDPELQGLHVGLFLAIAALLVFWVLLNRSVGGYEVRAVGFNPDAAEYAGMSVGRTYVKVMLICGAFAGLAGAIDVLGWQFRVATNDIQISQVGFLGIAVALLGRNTAVGTFFGALLFGALLNGTSVRNLDPAIFPPELATQLTGIIQGLIVLFVSAPVLITMVVRARRKLPGGRHSEERASQAAAS
jgi:general nucleoside transport system permease protein